MDDSLKVYFAGDIFNHKDLVGNLLLADAIKSVSDGRYHCILPQNLEQTTGRSIDIRNQDLLEVMRKDWPASGEADTVLRVDGGMVASDWTMQCLADTLGVEVDRPTVLETTALGAAYLAGLDAGFYPEPDRFAETWKLDRRFAPKQAAAVRDARYRGWQDAVRRTLTVSAS